MGDQLFQLLTRLDRDGATELVVASGRPVTLRVHGNYQTLTAAPVTLEQLLELLRETPLETMLPEGSGLSEPADVDLAGRWVRTQLIRSGDDLIVRFENLKGGPAPAVVTPRAITRATPPSGTPVTRPTPPPTAPPAVARAPTTPAPTRPPTAPVVARTPTPPTTAPAVARAPTPPSVARTPTPPTVARAPTPARPAARPITHPIVPPAPIAPLDEGPHLVDEPSEITPALMAMIRDARQRRATDLHITANRPVMIRAFNLLVPLDPTPRSAVDVAQLLVPLLGPLRRQQLEARGYVDLAIECGGRLRGNISRAQGGLKGTFRIAITQPPTLEDLGLPKELAKITAHHQGLVVIAGPSGHGKTTTLAALVDLLNSSEPMHILTIEDPVEIEHPRKAAVISQREVGRHTTSFAAALKASLREDPDVIVIGELRDRETVEIALTAAETGHLVLATMSTPSAAKTIDRLIDMFPPDDQSQVRASLAGALRAIVAQRLLPSVNGDAVVAAVEMVTGVLPLATLIRDNKLYQLPNLMQRGRAFGMIRLDESLAMHVRAGRISEEVAMRAADSRKELLVALHPDQAPAALAASAAAAKKAGGFFGGKKDP